MKFKVIELDKRSGEEVAVATYEGAQSESQAEAKASELAEKAVEEGKDYLQYWVSD